jgi:dihydrofolate reductase
VSIDGRITDGRRPGTAWTSREDKQFLHRYLDTCDAVVVGHTTYRAARRPLSRRNCVVFTRSVRQPVRRSPRLLYVNSVRTDVPALLGTLEYRRVCVLGGIQTYSFFFARRLIDELYLTVEPLVFGAGLSLVEGSRAASQWQLLSARRLNVRGTLLLRYQCVRKP